MKPIVIESQYLHGIVYFSLLESADEIIIDQNENYVRQTYRNRAEILGSNGVINLAVPVERGRSKQLIKETTVDNTSMSCLVKMTGLDVQWSYSEGYIDAESIEIQDYRSAINPKNRGEYRGKLSTQVYPQVFGSKFVQGMSLIDLLCCEGPSAGLMIRKMASLWQ